MSLQQDVVSCPKKVCPCPAGWYQDFFVVLVPSQNNAFGGNRGDPLRRVRVHAVTSRSTSIGSRRSAGWSPSRALENALQALDETEYSGVRSQCSVEGISSCITRSSFGCAIDRMSSFHPPFSEPSTEDAGMGGGTKGIGWSSRVFVQVVRRVGEKSRSSTQRGAVTHPAQILVVVPSEVGRGGGRSAPVVCRCLLPIFFRRTRASTCQGIIRLWTVDQQ